MVSVFIKERPMNMKVTSSGLCDKSYLSGYVKCSGGCHQTTKGSQKLSEVLSSDLKPKG